MVLLSNHKRNIVGLDGYGLNIVEQRAIDGCADSEQEH
jgi:3,4-dihydroxy 2-butanone 4-phosphate synthase/GTP cyclohydrolase II